MNKRIISLLPLALAALFSAQAYSQEAVPSDAASLFGLSEAAPDMGSPWEAAEEDKQDAASAEQTGVLFYDQALTAASGCYVVMVYQIGGTRVAIYNKPGCP